ncbi:MAG: site-specific DNA-methyltransferase [Flavobacteriales bacterium]|nr:site-specific DNA-methyltransferase [Flavobacteriales bacterium]
MSVVYDDGQVSLLHGDVRGVLRELPAESVNCVVTSPPYWSLRDYGVEPSVWGPFTDSEDGEPCLEHQWGEAAAIPDAYVGTARWQHDGISRAETPEAWGGARHQAQGATSIRQGRANIEAQRNDNLTGGQFCRVCGAWLGALGLEPTPELFVAHMVEVFLEVRRVLRPDGTLWLNMGDSYSSGGRGYYDDEPGANKGNHVNRHRPLEPYGLKPKDLVGIPWMLAFALRADGWWLRQDIIWSKPNPMPESTKDRCTKAHEYMFLLSKRELYWSDFVAIREKAGENTTTTRGREHRRMRRAGRRTKADLNRNFEAAEAAGDEATMTRNKRSVWHIPTAPFPEAHFATFPPALVEPCILAGCPEGGTVLDPFVGSGTTAMVARQLGRRAIGIDLNLEYMAMAVRRAGGQMAFIGDAGGVS